MTAAAICEWLTFAYYQSEGQGLNPIAGNVKPFLSALLARKSKLLIYIHRQFRGDNIN